jgi:hypothetical protein
MLFAYYNLFMLTPDWWAELSRREKVRIVRRVLNGETSVSWPLPGPAVRVFTATREREARRIQLPLPTPRLEREVRADRRVLVEHYSRVGQVQGWKYSVDLPSDLRRCKNYEECGQFFVISKVGQLFHKMQCAHDYQTAKCRREARELKIGRVRAAMKVFQGQPDWKEKTARRARVKKNFITHAIRCGAL